MGASSVFKPSPAARQLCLLAAHQAASRTRRPIKQIGSALAFAALGGSSGQGLKMNWLKNRTTTCHDERLAYTSSVEARATDARSCDVALRVGVEQDSRRTRLIFWMDRWIFALWPSVISEEL